MSVRKHIYITLIISIMMLIFGAADSWAISWNDDFDKALDEARENGKPLMVDFYTAWCHWCKELDSNTYTDAKVEELSDNFICVKVDADKNPNAAYKYNVRGYPTVIFLNYDSSVNKRVIGYKDPDVFAGIMELVLTNPKSPSDKKPSGKTEQAAVKKPVAAKTRDIKSDKKELERKQAQEAEKTGADALELTGIFIDRNNMPVAIINNIFVRKGDMIGEGRVTSITKDNAEVAFQDKTIVLKID